MRAHTEGNDIENAVKDGGYDKVQPATGITCPQDVEASGKEESGTEGYKPRAEAGN